MNQDAMFAAVEASRAAIVLGFAAVLVSVVLVVFFPMERDAEDVAMTVVFGGTVAWVTGAIVLLFARVTT